jgi:H-type lectin domain
MRLFSKRQDDTTNSTQPNTKIFYGRGKVTQTTTTNVAETVTFPEAFTSTPVVVCQFMGYNTTGAWIDNPASDWGGMTFSAQNATTTSFTARGRRNDGADLHGDYYYSWIAIGQ